MNIGVNEDQWNSLSDEDKKKISSIIGGYFKGSSIVTEKAVSKAALGNPFCEAACDIAATAAKGVCFNLGDPTAIAVCIAAAEAAQRECKKRC